MFNLDGRRPIIDGRRLGHRGAAGHVQLQRHDAPEILFEPASRINVPGQLTTDLDWQKIPTDGEGYGYTADHCHRIAHVVRLLCGATDMLTAEDETQHIVSTFLELAVQCDDPGHLLTTYGGSPQRYAAATALQREVDQLGRPAEAPKYLLDAYTGEHVIRVSDLEAFTRQHLGSSLARGFLDARMQTIGFTRISIDGHERGGEGRVDNPHARCSAYRGHMPTPEPDPLDDALSEPADAHTG